MVHPWEKGRRHRSWASDTIILAVVFVCLLVATVFSAWLDVPKHEAPGYLTGLLGAAGAALFGAVSSDKGKREKDIDERSKRAERRTLTLNEDIIRTERKTDKLAKLAREEHPDRDDVPEPLIKDPDDQGVT